MIRPEEKILNEAVAFATRKHQGQMRKDGVTPYVSHPLRVMALLRGPLEVNQPLILAAAVLHDVLEDTPTDFDDLQKRFGETVAWWVSWLTQDKSVPEQKRDEGYLANLAKAGDAVKVIKIADACDNLMDAENSKDEGQLERTLARAKKYYAVFKSVENERTKTRLQFLADLIEEKSKVLLESQKPLTFNGLQRIFRWSPWPKK